MAAYGLEDRFRTSKDCNRLLDPTSYDLRTHIDLKQNKYPFHSSNARNTFCASKTIDTIYDPNIKPRIPCITALKSKTPRFPYEAYKPEDTVELLCRCGFEDPCECPIDEDKGEPDVVCQANVRKRLFLGPPPRSIISTGLSAPSKRDHGFEILPNGTTRRLLDIPKDTSPPFYDAPIPEFTQFYRGCKWSRWTSTRKSRSSYTGPAPTDYDVGKDLSETEKCQERVRSYRRKNSKQPRYLEQIQKILLKQNFPGPAHYYPRIMDTSIQRLGTLAERFPIFYSEKRPGPAEYSLKRVGDLPKPPKLEPFHAHMPPAAPFGTSAPRFRYRTQKLPGPGEYDANVKLGKILNCNENAPFLSSQKRWKEDKIDTDEDDYEGIVSEDKEVKPCSHLSWQFKSKTKRFKRCEKEFNASKYMQEEVPAEPVIIKRAPSKKVPFFSSEKRFQPCFNFIPDTQDLLGVIGPGSYSLEKVKCYPAVCSGPLYRAAPRLKQNLSNTPSPNQYTLEPSIDSIFATHNLKLRNNVSEKRKRHSKCAWKLPVEPREFSKSERILKILDRTIDHLDIKLSDMDETKDEEESVPVERPPMSKISLILLDVEQTLTLDTAAKASEGETMQAETITDAEEIISEKDTKKPEIAACQEIITEKTAEVEAEIKENTPEKPMQKLLRTFLYKHPQKIYF